MHFLCRRAVGVSVFSFLCACAPAQLSTLGEPKALTPEQKSYRQQTQEVDARRQTLLIAAHAAFNAEMAREKAGDCHGAESTVDFNTCFGNSAEAAGKNLKAFEDAIRAMLALHYPTMPGESATPMTGPEGRAQTPEQSVAEFDKMEQLWHAYMETASSAAFDQFDGGSGAPSAALETQLRLIRNHMRELDRIYGMMLHL